MIGPRSTCTTPTRHSTTCQLWRPRPCLLLAPDDATWMQAVDHRLRSARGGAGPAPPTTQVLILRLDDGKQKPWRGGEYSDEIKAQVMAWKCDGYVYVCGATIQIAISTLGAPRIHLRTGFRCAPVCSKTGRNLKYPISPTRS